MDLNQSIVLRRKERAILKKWNHGKLCPQVPLLIFLNPTLIILPLTPLSRK